LLFQTLDDKKECVGFYQSGELSFDGELPTSLSRTWGYSAFLKNNPNPTEDEIKDAMQGNICRCASYTRIYKAVEIAASKMA